MLSKLPVPVLILVLLEVESKWFHSFAGPFNVDFKRVERCPPELQSSKSFDFHYITRKVPGQLPLYNVNVTTPVTVDDTLNVTLNLASWSNNGGWKTNAFFITVKTICKDANLHLRPLFEHAMVMVFGEILCCSFLEGIYRTENATVPQSYLNSPLIPTFVYGRWRGDAVVCREQNHIIACGRIFADTVPK